MAIGIVENTSKKSQPTMPTWSFPLLCFSPHAGRTDAMPSFPPDFPYSLRSSVVRPSGAELFASRQSSITRVRKRIAASQIHAHAQKGGNRKGGFVTFPSRLLILEIVSIFGFLFCPLHVRFHLSCASLANWPDGLVLSSLIFGGLTN